MEKYGFVYIWRDRKYPRFYIGSHWGTEVDGYVCSSRWMRNTYKRRPEDFKRKILARIYTSKHDLLLDEGKWLSLIPEEEIGKRYYNLHNAQPGHWSATDSSLSIKEKLTKASQEYWEENIEARQAQAKRLKKQREDLKFLGNLREGQRERWSDQETRDTHSVNLKESWSDLELRARQSEIQTKRFEDPKEHGKLRGAQQKRLVEHPEYSGEQSARMLKHYAEHPEICEKLSQIQIERYKDPKEHEKLSVAQTRRWANPEARKAQSEALKRARRALKEAA